MATAKQIKKRLRAHVNQRMVDFRDANQRELLERVMYRNYAYGAVWASSYADAITDTERAALMAELNGAPGAAITL